MTWTDGIPVLLTLPLFAAGAALIAVAVHALVRPLVPVETLREQHDIVAALLSVVGVLYSVVLGFLVGTVWTSFEAAQQNADQEIRFVAVAVEYAKGLPEPARSRIQQLLAQYAVEVRDNEWKMLRHGEADPRALDFLDRATRVLLVFTPPRGTDSVSALKEQAIATAAISDLRSVAVDRVQRVTDSRQRLPSIVFEALILGAVFVMSFVLFFGTKRVWVQLCTTALLAGCIGLFFGVIVDLNSPYGGPIRVNPDSWTAVIDAGRLRDLAK